MNRSNRRTFLMSAGVAGLTASHGWAAANHRRPSIAFLGTVDRKHSHAQHFLDRHIRGYAWHNGWQQPRIDLASVYIDQLPDGDLSQQRIKKHRLHSFPTIEEALTLGGEKLAVDGVVIIGEHGDYPRNEKGQKRYPRYEWFKKVVKVFEESGRSVPVFNDKHLSTRWDECVEMVADSRRLEFPFLAGSSLPVTRRMPESEMPYGAELQESVCVAYGGVDSYDIHALETAQCMSERRGGGECGVRSIQALKDENFYRRLQSDDCRITRELITAALCRSHNLPVTDGFPTAEISWDWMRSALPQVTAYLIEHRDGLRTTMLLTGIRDFNYAGRLGDGTTISCQMYLPMPGHGSTTADFFNPLVRHVETMMLDRKAPYPVERTLLTSGMVIGGVNSLFANEVALPTPHLDVSYSAPSKSLYWQM